MNLFKELKMTATQCMDPTRFYAIATALTTVARLTVMVDPCLPFLAGFQYGWYEMVVGTHCTA